MLILVSRRPTDQSTDQLLNLHRLVHLATRNWLRTEGSLPEWTARSIARLGDIFPDNDHQNRALWRAYLPHARYVLDSGVLLDDRIMKLQLLRRFGLCLLSDGRYNEAEKPFLQAEDVRNNARGRASFHVNQHGQPSGDVHVSRTMGGGRKVTKARAEDMFKGFRAGASFHANKHG